MYLNIQNDNRPIIQHLTEKIKCIISKKYNFIIVLLDDKAEIGTIIF